MASQRTQAFSNARRLEAGLPGWLWVLPSSTPGTSGRDDDLDPEPVGVWTFAWHGHGSGGAIHTWVYPDEESAWLAAAEAARETLADDTAVAEQVEAAGMDGRALVALFNERGRGTRMEVALAFLQLRDVDRQALVID